MISWFINFFGQYQPLSDPGTGIPYEGIASVDFTYIGTVCLFFLMLLYVLRIILAFFKGVNWK